MTKKEFERLRNFISRHGTSKISSSYCAIYLHSAEADQASPGTRWIKTPRYSLEFSSLKVDVERDVVIGRERFNEKIVHEIPRKRIKTVSINVCCYADPSSGARYYSDRF